MMNFNNIKTYKLLNMENIESMAVIISIFGSAVLVIFVLAKYNYLIKKAYAEKGLQASGKRVNYMEIGCIVIGIAIGLGTSSIFTVMPLAEDTMELLIYSTILLGGGLGLLAAHYRRNKGERD